MTRNTNMKPRELREAAAKLFAVYGDSELVAHQLGIPRSAVRKYVERVRQEGRRQCQ